MLGTWLGLKRLQFEMLRDDLECLSHQTNVAFYIGKFLVWADGSGDVLLMIELSKRNKASTKEAHIELRVSSFVCLSKCKRIVFSHMMRTHLHF